MKAVSSNKPIQILLADDDRDNCFFFKEALSSLPIPVKLTTVDDSERLMNYLSENSLKLPDVLFLDLNMPRKNGSECLKEIKLTKEFSGLPVIIYSTSLHEVVANELFKTGAHYYIKKTNLTELKKALHFILNIMKENKFNKPLRNKFILGLI
jgi:CheY-like chemotaxis protein